MVSNPYMALVEAESSNPYMDIVKGEGEDYKSATGILKGAGQIAGSLITPLVAWPLAKYIGAVRGAHAWSSGDKEPGKVFDEAYEDAMQRMTGIYQPLPESPAERTIRPVVKVFEALAGGGSEAGKLVSESLKLPPEGMLSRIVQTGGEFGAFTAGGKAGGGLKRGAKAGAAGLLKAASAKRLEASLDYHPLVEPPPAPPTGKGFGIPIIRPPTSGKVITAPTSEKEVARLEAKVKPPKGFELVKDSDKAVPSEPILPEESEGKPVPSEVLADYPDLAKSSVPAATPEVIGRIEPKHLPRKLGDIVKDINDALGEAGSIGNKEFTEKQKLARQRLSEDMQWFREAAEKSRLSLEDYLSQQGFDADAISKMIRIAPISSTREPVVEPPTKGTKESKLAKRAEAAAIEIKLTDDFGDLVEYRIMNMKEQAEAAQHIMDWNYESAKRMAMGEESPPTGVREATMYEAVKIRALKEGDVETLRKLATESTVPRKLSEYGQAIKAADSRLMIDPVTDMRDVMKARAERAKRTGSKVDFEKQAAEIERLNKELEVAKKALDEHIARKKAEEQAAAIDELLGRKKPQVPKAQWGAKNKFVTLADYNRVKSELREQLGSQLSAGLDPTIAAKLIQLGAFHFEAGARVFGEWSAKMVEDFGDFVKPHLKDLWERGKAVAVSNEVKFLADKISDGIAKDKDLPDIASSIQELSLQFVEMGIRDREANITAVHNVIKEIIPSITRRETMDAMSNYGKWKKLTHSETLDRWREIKSESQQVAKLEDLKVKGFADKTGKERQAKNAETRRLEKLVNQYKKKYGIQTTDKETQLRSSLDAIKTRLTNEIADLDAQIESRQKIVKDNAKIVYDAEANALKAKRDERQAVFDQIFAKPELTHAQRAQIAINKELIALEASITKKMNMILTEKVAPEQRISKELLSEDIRLMRQVRGVLNTRIQEMRNEARPKGDPELRRAVNDLIAADKSITELLHQISTGDVATKKRIPRTVTEDVRLMRVAIDILKEQRQEMRDLLNPKKTPDEIANQRLKTRLKNEEQKFRDKLENRDFSKKEKRVKLLDPERRILEDKHERAKENYNAASQMSRAITKEEATNLVSLSQIATDAKTVMEQGGDRFAYGAARVAYENYVNDLHGANLPIKAMLKNRLHEAETAWSENKVRAVGDVVKDTLKVIADNSVSMVATLDNSFLGRQGIHTLMTEPVRFIQAKRRGIEYKNTWWRAAKKSFSDFASTIGGKNAHDALMADIYSRPNFLNGEYQKAGIITGLEEQFPTTLPERIPGIGRVFRASEYAFTGSGLRMRTGLYDLLSEIAKSNGVNMSDKVQAESVGKLINSLTARGKWGKRGEPDIVRLVLWAPKMLKGNWDVLTAHTGGYGLESAFARKQAGLNLLSIVAEIALIMAIANAIKPNSAETNPISPGFGKIKTGDTYFDYSGRLFSLITLAERLRTGKTKDPVTGRIKPMSRFNALINFFAGKTNPPASMVRDWLKEYHYGREPFTWPTAAYKAATPITIQQAIELKDNASADRVAGVIADAVGVSASQYDRKKIHGRAQGGPIKRGIPYVVGEKGPEIIIPRQDGFVIPGNAIKSRSSFLPIPAARVEKFRGNPIPMP